MKVFVLVTYAEYDLQVDVYDTKEAAEHEFMRYLYECYQDAQDLPDSYDPLAISDWLGAMGESFVWTITEQDVMHHDAESQTTK